MTMRAMILAAGLGSRMHPFTQWRAKPALPVRGIPVIGYLLRLLEAHGIREVLVNLHHQSQSIRDAVAGFGPAGVEVRFNPEATLLGTGGGIRGAAEFLAESETSLVITGDMILDLDLTRAIDRHRERDDLASLVLCHDPRAEHFGTIGIAADGGVRRIAESFDRGGETQAGVFSGVRIFSARILETLPERECFEDLRDWLIPLLEIGEERIRGELCRATECVWEPVGTPAEYLQANLVPKPLAFMDADRLARKTGTRFEGDLVIGAGAQIDAKALLERTVIWDGESVPAGTRGLDGVFANGKFHDCSSGNRRLGGAR